ncbi:MAG TPA: TAXI family TRAP transporter solute-binding subunit [Burkholderiales bacterium]|nr:TAXI family TRAP transporter solute-binding subunit [Burkholderiales bacterium]
MPEAVAAVAPLSESRNREAQLLADMLRISRLTVLYGADGAGKTTLLKTGVLPLLRRRAGDRRPARPAEPRVVVPFPHCRRTDRKALAEIAVFFDAWGDMPLARLVDEVAAALPSGASLPGVGLTPLAETFGLWSKELGVRFLLVLDQFEQFLAAPRDLPGVLELESEFARMLVDHGLPVHLLVSVREDAEPLMEGMRAGVPGLADASLRLYPFDTPRPSAPKPRQESLRAALAIAGPTLVPVEIENRQSAANPGAAAEGSTPLAHAEAAQASEPEERPPVAETSVAPAESAKARMPLLKWAAASGAFVAVLFVIWAVQHFPAEPLPLRVTLDAPHMESVAQPAPEPPLPGANLPPVMLSIEPGNSTDREIARDLARLVGPDAGARIVARPESPNWTDDETPQLAVMRYEALDAASRSRSRSAGALEKLRVVTPLYTEEIYVIVRRDSPLTSIHEIRDIRINVGPEDSSRGLTASRLYERMFGTPMQPANVSTLSDDDAIARLIGEKSIDAMIVVAGQPARWLKDLAPEIGQSIKLLKLDSTDPIGQKAVEAYLPTTVRSAHYGKWLSENVPSLATMSFLVAPESSNAAAAERVDAFLRTLCGNIAALRKQGHPKWREVQLGLELETGWPYLASAKNAFSACSPS